MESFDNRELESLLRGQTKAALIDVLIGLATDFEDVRNRLHRLKLATRPKELSRRFRATLDTWKRSNRYHDYRETGAYATEMMRWLDQVARELLPVDASAAARLFQTFIESDRYFFEHADDSDGEIGDALRHACTLWLRAAAAAGPAPEFWISELTRLYDGDDYGARAALLSEASLLLETTHLQQLVGNFEGALLDALKSPRAGGYPNHDVYSASAALNLLSEAMHDPDIHVRAVLSYSPQPNGVQKEEFAKAYLEVGRAQDALHWLEGAWESQFEDRRLRLRAKALAQLGRHAESASILEARFRLTLSEHDLSEWLSQLPESEHEDARSQARALALAVPPSRDTAAAELLLALGEDAEAETRLIDAAAVIDGERYYALNPLAKSMRERGRVRGEVVIHRALLASVLARARSTAYRHAAASWRRLIEIDRSGADIAPLTPHSAFEAAVRLQHRRKHGFWTAVEAAMR